MAIKKETIKTDDQGKYHYWLYSLSLEQEKYYVGITKRINPISRIGQHFSGYYGAQWTKKYRPETVLEMRDLGCITRSEAEYVEKKETLRMMDVHGYQNVRGGDLVYRGEYVKRFNRFFTDKDYAVLTTVIFLMLAIIYLTIHIYFLHPGCNQITF